MQRFSTIYVYTTPLKEADGRLKIGSAFRVAETAEEAARTRILEQKHAGSADEEQIIRHVEDVTDIAPSQSMLIRLEKKLHKRWRREGRWCNPKARGSEWFWITVDEVRSILHGIRYGVERPHCYPPRTEQQDCVTMAVNYYNNGGYQFLINAKMRFGKTFVAYLIAKAIKAQRILVLSYKGQVDVGWQEDLENHVEFDGSKFIHKDDFEGGQQITLNHDGMAVVWSSYQDINQFTKPKWKKVLKEHFDLVIIDEYHFGAGTDRASQTLKAIKHDHILCLSGTPIRALLSGEFEQDAIYTWSYNDEQRRKQTGSAAHQNLPTLKMHVFEVGKEVHSLLSRYEDEEGFTLTKMFASDNGKTPNDLAAVNLFLDRIAGNGVHKNLSPFRFRGREVDLNHTIWFVPPRKFAVQALANTIRKHSAFADFEVFAAYGNSEDITDKALNDVRRMVRDAKMHGKKTITIAGVMLNTGVTVTEWNGVFMLNDTDRPETYFQSIFRCQSPGINKPECHVIDFAPQRAMIMAYQYAEIMAPNGVTTEEYLEEWLDFAPILDHTSNKLRKVEVGDILSTIAEQGNYVSQFTHQRMFNKERLSNEVVEILSQIEAAGVARTTISVNENDIHKGRNKRKQERKKKTPTSESEAKKVIDQLIRKAQAVTAGLPQFLACTDAMYNSCLAIAKVNKVHKQMFFDFTGVEPTSFWSLVESGFLNEKRLNRSIVSFNVIMTS